MSERDDVWLRELIGVLDARIGRAAGNLEREARDALSPVCRAHRVDARALRGAIRVALKDFRRAVDASLDPAVVRGAVFREAAAVRSARGNWSPSERSAVLARVAGDLGVDPQAIEAMLYADHPKRRLVEGPPTLPSPAELRGRYQLALLQGFLLRSSEVRLWVRSHVRAVARFAKLSRLLCTFEIEGDATKMVLSGPLALFHATLKYGRALAGFIPTVVSTPGWRLEAGCVLPEETLRLRVDAGAPLPRTHVLPRDTDSKLEARLVRDLRRLGTGWAVARETAALQVGARTFFPDFTLTRGPDRVLVEVVGFWTPEYLASKLRALGSVSSPLVVVVDGSHGVVSADLPAAELVTFTKFIDAESVVAAADRAARRAQTIG